MGALAHYFEEEGIPTTQISLMRKGRISGVPRFREVGILSNGAMRRLWAAKVNGATLAYREQGEGEPVVFVHGTISDLRVAFLGRHGRGA